MAERAGMIDSWANAFLPDREALWNASLEAQGVPIKVRRDLKESKIFLEITPCSLNQVACDVDKTTLSRYMFTDIKAVYGCDDRAASLVVVHGGRGAGLGMGGAHR